MDSPQIKNLVKHITNFDPYLFSFGTPIAPVKSCKLGGSEYQKKSAKRMNGVSTTEESY